MSSEPEQKLKPQTLGDMPTFPSVNKKVFGLIKFTSLKDFNNRRSPSYTIQTCTDEKNMRSELTLKATVARKLDYKSTSSASRKNPRGQQFHHLFVDCPVKDILSLEVMDAEKVQLPAYFGAKDFDPVNKQFVVWTTKVVSLNGTHIPELLDPDCEKIMTDLSNELLRTKTSGDLFEFCAIVHKYEHNGIFIQGLLDAFARDRVVDPMLKWIRNSPIAHHLQIPNILPVHERPQFSRENLILRKRRGYQDRLEMKVHLAYAATNEHSYAVGELAEWTREQFDVQFFALEDSCYKESEDDNELPKLYFAIMPWDNKSLDRPNPGDSFKCYINEKVPDCPVYKGDFIKRTRFADDEDENAFGEGSHDTGGDDGFGFGDITHAPSESKEDKEDRMEAHRKKQQDDQVHTWRAFALKPNATCPPGYISMMFVRPTDGRYMGPPGSAPRVLTKLRSFPTTYRNTERFYQQIKETVHSGYKLVLIPDDSNQTYKDVMGGLHAFFEQGTDLVDTDIQQHLAEYLVNFDDDLPFPEINFLADIACKDYEKFLHKLSPYQRDAFKRLTGITHGILFVVGCVASAKTYFGILIILAAIANENRKGADGIKIRTTCTYVTETNALTNQAARDIYEECKHHGLKKKIVRVHSLPSEKSKLEARIVPVNHKDNMPKTTIATDFFIQEALQKLGLGFETERKMGDKRRDPGLSNLSLDAAMWERLNDPEYSCTEHSKIKSILHQMKDSPNEALNFKPELNSLVKELMEATMKNTDVLVMTTAAAMRQVVADVCKHRHILVHDEAAKSTPPVTTALKGRYAPKDFHVSIGDTVQELPFCITADNPAFWNAFYQTSIYTELERAVDSGAKVIFLYEQHRSWTTPLNAHNSDYWYNRMMVDGTLGKAKPVEYQFVAEVMQENWDISEGNFMIIAVNDSKSQKEEGGKSMSNAHHQHIVGEIVKAFQQGIQKTELKFDKSKFDILVTSPYKLASNNLDILITDLNCKFARVLSGGKLQGLSAGVVILELDNQDIFSKFVGDVRRLLVQCTRHRYGLIIVCSANAINPDSYNCSGQPHRMFKDGRVKHLYALTSFAESTEALRYTDAPNLNKCNNCGSGNHLLSGCNEPRQPYCFQCFCNGHVQSECPDAGIITVPEREFKGKCNVCKKQGHRSNSAECTGCKNCGTDEHPWIDCPLSFCKTCNTKGLHWTSKCPKKDPCGRCGSMDHSKKYCKVPISRKLLSAQPFMGEDNDDDKDSSPQESSGQGWENNGEPSSQAAPVGDSWGGDQYSNEADDTEFQSEIELAIKRSLVTRSDLERSAPTTEEQSNMHIDHATALSKKEKSLSDLPADQQAKIRAEMAAAEKKRHKDAMKGKKSNSKAAHSGKQSSKKGSSSQESVTDFTSFPMMSIHVDDNHRDEYLAGSLQEVRCFYSVPDIHRQDRMNLNHREKVAVQFGEGTWALGWIWLLDGKKHVSFYHITSTRVFSVSNMVDKDFVVVDSTILQIVKWDDFKPSISIETKEVEQDDGNNGDDGWGVTQDEGLPEAQGESGDSGENGTQYTSGAQPDASGNIDEKTTAVNTPLAEPTTVETANNSPLPDELAAVETSKVTPSTESSGVETGEVAPVEVAVVETNNGAASTGTSGGSSGGSSGNSSTSNTKDNNEWDKGGA